MSSFAERWLEACREAARAADRALARRPDPRRRGESGEAGAGGDTSIWADTAAEEAVIESLEAFGRPATVITEERGELKLNGGGETHVVIDPVDGSRNAGRGLPAFALSIAIASGHSMAAVDVAYVHDLARGDAWWALRGAGAFRDGERLEVRGGGAMIGLESAAPRALAAAGPALAETGARRIRSLGSVALSLCAVSAGWLDGMVSLAPARSVDAAAGQLIVREAGGAVAFPDAGDGVLSASVHLDMRSRVVAAADAAALERLAAVGAP